MKSLLFIILLLTTSVGISQERKALFGIVRDSIGIIADVHLVNGTSKQGTISSEMGAFKIFAKIGDTITFSSVQHIEKKYLVNAHSFNFEGLTIYLLKKVYELDEINLEKKIVFGRLEIDLNSVPKSNRPIINATTLGLPNAGLPLMKKVDREIYTATTSASGVSVDLILNVLSGRLKKLKKKKKIVEEDEDVARMYGKFKHLLYQNFNIKEENTYVFLYFCSADSLYRRDLLNNEFTFIKFMQRKSTEFKELKKQ